MKTIHTKHAPQAVGPYTQAIESNDFIFCSGQIGLDPITGTLREGIEEQTKQVMQNIQQVLKAANCTFDSVIKTTIFLTDINDFTKVNDVYGSFFSEHKPARSTVAVTALPKGALVEIEVIAVK